MIKCDKEPFAFKSKNCPAQIKEPEAFEEDLIDIVKSTKYRNINCMFQNLFKADILQVKASPNVSIPEQQTCMNFYQQSTKSY